MGGRKIRGGGCVGWLAAYQLSRGVIVGVSRTATPESAHAARAAHAQGAWQTWSLGQQPLQSVIAVAPSAGVAT